MKRGVGKGINGRTALPKKRRENRGRAGLPMKVKQRFLEELAKCGFYSEAAEAVGVAPSTPHRWARASEQFSEMMKQRKEEGGKMRLDVLERVTHERAIREKNPSDNLAMFHMKRLDPAYRDNVIIGKGADSVNLQINVFSGNAPPFRPRDGDPSTGHPQPIDLNPGEGES